MADKILDEAASISPSGKEWLDLIEFKYIPIARKLLADEPQSEDKEK